MNKTMYVALSATLFLAGCGGINHAQSVKSADYKTTPRNVVAILQNADPSFPAFKARFAQEMGHCGIRVLFAETMPGQTNVSALADTDGLLVFRELGREKTTLSTNFRNTDEYISSYRYEITLTDVASKRPVWKGQGDFKTTDNSNTQTLGKLASLHTDVAWTDDLIALMKKDGLVGDCRDDRAPTPVVATASPQTIEIPLPASGPKVRFNVGKESYDTIDAAEAALRANAARELEQVQPLNAPSRGALLIATPSREAAWKRFANSSKMNSEQMGAVVQFSAASGKVGFDAIVEAITKSGLFSPVSEINEDDLGWNDYHGATFKLAQGRNGWLLTKEGVGQEQVVKTVPAYEPTAAKLNTMLGELQSAVGMYQ